MQLLDNFKRLLEHPFFKSLAEFIKMFKSSKSFYSIFYFLALFITQQAIAWKYGTALSAWFNSQGDAWYWQLGAFVSEYGSIELVGLGVVLLAILAFVEVKKAHQNTTPTHQGNSIDIDGDNSGVVSIGNHNNIEHKVEKVETMVIHNHRSIHWTPFIILAFSVLLSALPQVKSVDVALQQMETYQREIHTLNKKRLRASSLEEKIKIESEIKERKQKIVEIEEYRGLLKTLSLKLAKEAEKIHKYYGIDEAIVYLQGNKAQTQQQALDKRMKEFAQKFKLEAKLLIIQKRYDEATQAYKSMIVYDRSYEALYEYAHFLHRQNAFQEAVVIYHEILRLDELSAQNRALTLHKLATIYYNHNHLNKALETYQKALAIRQTLHNNRWVADTLNNIGLIYEKQKIYHKAEQYYNDALALETSLGKNKPTFTVAKTLNNLGRLYKNQKREKQALNNYSDALSITKNLIENNATNRDYKDLLAKTHNNLGNLYREQQKYRDVNRSFDKAHTIYQELAKSNPSRYSDGIAMTLHNYGQLYLDLNKTQEAYEVFTRANAIYYTLAKSDPYAYNYQLANSYLSLEYYHKLLNQKERAKKSYTKAFDIYEKLVQTNPNLYELKYAKMIVKGVYLYNIGTENLKIAQEILSRPKYKGDALVEQFLKAIESIGK